jgi:two-component system OmpR family response regulator
VLVPPVASGDPATVLVVEDDPGIRSMLELALGAAGYRVLVTADVARARAALSEEPVDLVLLDLHLGGEQTVTLERYAGELSGIPTVMMSAADPPWSSSHETAWLQKPFTLESLYAQVATALGSTRETTDSGNGRGGSG